MGKKFKKSPNPFNGSTEAFRNSELEETFNNTMSMKGFVFEDLLEQFREQFKDCVAILIEHATKLCANKYIVPEKCRKIINSYFGNEFESSFISCTLDYYNGQKAHIVQKLNLSCPSCNAKESCKAFRQSRMNCRKGIKKYVNKIIDRLKTHRWKNVSDDMVQKYQSIGVAADFTCYYLTQMHIGKIPNKLSCDTYQLVNNLNNSNVKDLYVYDKVNNCYKSVNAKKRLYYSQIDQECATFLICSNYKRPSI